MSSPDTFELFKKSLSGRDPKTIKAYVLSLLGFISWLEKQPGGTPFEPAKITTTAVNSYLEGTVHKHAEIYAKDFVNQDNHFLSVI